MAPNTRLGMCRIGENGENDFKADKQAEQMVVGQGHDAIDPALLKPYTRPVAEK